MTHSKEEILSQIKETGLIPIIRVASKDVAFKVAEAFLEGGLNVIEVTFSVPNAVDVVRSLTEKYGDDVIIGTGTVLDTETARAAILAGSEFIVSPIFSRELIEISRRYARPCFPGAVTPTEILNAYQWGADAVKVFPASSFGGASYIKNVRGPLPQIPLIPTGGVNLDTAEAFIKAGVFALGVGGAITDKKAISEGRYDVITENVKKFQAIVKKARSEM